MRRELRMSDDYYVPRRDVSDRRRERRTQRVRFGSVSVADALNMLDGYDDTGDDFDLVTDDLRG